MGYQHAYPPNELCEVLPRDLWCGKVINVLVNLLYLIRNSNRFYPYEGHSLASVKQNGI